MNYLDFVMVVDTNDKPCRPILSGYAGYLLRKNNASIINHEPLVIKRTDNYSSKSENRKSITCKIDMGYMNVGFSVGDEDNEFLAGEVKLLKGIPDRIQARASYRRTRRGRLRYRRNKNADYKTVHNPTYKNGNENGWLAPSMQHKIDSHVRFIEKISKWIPIDKVILEIASFDIQKIKAEIEGKEISGIDYQRGEMYGYENVKQYVRERDNYKCQLCGVSGLGKVLEVHHIIPRSNSGSNKPNNLICLCHNCHINKVHSNKNDNKYFRELQSRKINDTYKDSTFMNTARWHIYNAIGNLNICETQVSFGYITKKNRENANLPKFHYVDAACIGKYTYKTLTQTIYIIEQKKCNDRCMTDFSDAKYIDKRDNKIKSGSELSYSRKSTAVSKRTTCKEDIENNRIFRTEKVKKGTIRKINHSYCLKPGDLICIQAGKRKGVIGEVTTMQIEKDRYKVLFAYDCQDVKYPSIRLSNDEYKQLKYTGACSKMKIVRTRRGMIWRRNDRLKYEIEYNNQYD